MSNMAIAEGSRVSLHFSLSLTEGGTVDSNFDGKPASFTLGDGNLLPGFERVLLGLQAGDRKTFTIPPEDAFGQPNPSNLQRLERSEISADIDLEPGLVLSFAEPSGGELPGVVAEFDDQWATIDFNHPLAGRSILFDVHILEVTDQVKSAVN